MAKRVSLFVTCIVDQAFPRVGLAVADILERLGYEIDFPEAQTCCGQPAFNSGYWDEARPVAQHFLKTFEKAEYIIVPSGSCASMVGHHYEELLGHHDKRVYEFTQFLTDVAGVEDLGAKFPHVVTYHDSCHALRELHLKGPTRRLLSRVKGLELREMEAAEECCGFGGTFSVKFDEVSGGMAKTKIESIHKTGAEYVVSVDSSCLMQLEGSLRRMGSNVRTIHLAEVLNSR